MAFYAESPAAGPWPSGTEDRQVSSAGCSVAAPRSWGWCQAGSGSWSGFREAAWSCRLLGHSSKLCSHPRLGAPGEEGAWLPPAVLTLTPDSSRELGRVNVLLYVTLWAGMGLLGRGCFLIGFRLPALLCCAVLRPTRTGR